MAKELVAMLLAGGQGVQIICTDTEACKACSSVWGKVPYH